MQLTERDKQILQFINSVGWCVAPQIGKRFGMKWWIVYRVMKRLTEAGLVIHQRLRLHMHGVFYLSQKGAEYTDLPAIDRVIFGVFDHQRHLVDVVIRLLELYPTASWISERHLKHEKFCNGIGNRGHVSDGIFVFSPTNKVAIEVELSVKGRERLKGILRSYTANLEVNEVWYFCSSAAINQVSELTLNKSRYKVHQLEEYLR